MAVTGHSNIRGRESGPAAHEERKQVNTARIFYRSMLSLALLLVLYLMTAPLDQTSAAGVNDKVAHLLVFLLLAWLADFSFPRSGFGAIKIAALGWYGLSLEFLQYFLPYRSCSLLDFGADVVGILLYPLLVPLLRRFPVLRWRWCDDLPRSDG